MTVKENAQVVLPYRDEYEQRVVDVWYRSGRSTYTFLPDWQSLTLKRAGEIFREVILPRCTLWVGIHDEDVAGFLAMNGSYIDRMYVDPAVWRNGWGTRFVVLAKELFPDGLELCTHQDNHSARKFYEHHEFRPVRFGISPAPESAPDVEYHWRPDTISD